MQVILLDKVANTGSWVIRLTLKRAMLVTSSVPQGKAVPATKKTLNSSKHVALNWKPNWLTFCQLLKLVLRRSTPRNP